MDYCSLLIAHSDYSCYSINSCSIKILNYNPNQNALDYLASGSRFRRIASLEILTIILIKIQNYYSCYSYNSRRRVFDKNKIATGISSDDAFIRQTETGTCPLTLLHPMSCLSGTFPMESKCFQFSLYRNDRNA